MSHFSQDQIRWADEALHTWGKYLRGEYKHIGRFEQHILPFGELLDSSDGSMPPNINRYLTRGVQIDAACSNSTSFIFSKLGPFAIFGFIDVQNPQQWKGTKVSSRYGWFEPRSFTVPHQLWDYLKERASRLMLANAKMSAAQQEKIHQTFIENKDKFLNSGLFRAMSRDVEMFGDEAFTKYKGSNDKDE